MSFDCSRFTFDPLKDYLGVVMQQGRVQLDSDWNEWQAQFARRIQAGTLDTLGRMAYPVNITPYAFQITPSHDNNNNPTVTIGPGRMYVDGLLAENHGPPPATLIVTALNNTGNYGVQLSPLPGKSSGQFVFSLYGATSGAQPSTLIGSVTTSFANVQADVSKDATLKKYIQVQASAGQIQPVILTTTPLYMLAQTDAGYQATIPISCLQWDPALAELSGAPEPLDSSPPADVAIQYTQQPYYIALPGNMDTITGKGPFLFYLDVWQKPVTALQDSDLIDKAVGVDTTGRIQTVWEVKYIDLKGASVDSFTPDGQIPGWQNFFEPPAAVLSTDVVQSSTSGPCCLAPSSSYTGLENQLYRVEIYRPGVPATNASHPTVAKGTATFKWSRDNASLATLVSAITPATTVNPATGAAGDVLTVNSLGRDGVMCFAPGDWIEITDDYQEMNTDPAGISGEVHQILSVSSSSSPYTITLADTVSDFYPTDNNNQTDPSRHTRIRRWDQKGKIYLVDSAGNQTLYFDLDAVVTGKLPQGMSGIPVPPAGSKLLLENGITVEFGWNSNPNNAPLKSGDFWTFAARSSDGSVEILNQAPPQGIYHHYAKLAIVSFPGTVTDLRVPWPPQCGACCSITLSPQDLEGDGLALQHACDSLAGRKGGAYGAAICLMPGDYFLGHSLELDSSHSGLTIEACHGGANLHAAQVNSSGFSDGLIAIADASDITLDGLGLECVVAPLPKASPAAWWMVGVQIQHCSGVTIENCQITAPASSPLPGNLVVTAGILATDQCSALTIERNQFTGPAPGQVSFGFIMAPHVGLSVLSSATFRLNEFQGWTVALFSYAVTGNVVIRENTTSGCFGGFWLTTADPSQTLQQAAADNSLFQSIATALKLIQPSAVPMILEKRTPQLQVANNQVMATISLPPTQKSSTGWALLLAAANETYSSAVVNANDLRAAWYNNVVLISGFAYSSITSNVIANLLTSAPPDTTGKLPLSLGVFPANTPAAIAGNFLSGRSNLGSGSQRPDVVPFDNSNPALAQLNTWKFLNYEPLPPRVVTNE